MIDGYNVNEETNAAFNSIMEYTDYKYREVAIGGLQNRNQLIEIQDVKKLITGSEDYQTMFRFNEDVKTYYDITKNDKGNHTLSGYSGTCYTDYLTLDIDRENELPTSYKDVKYLLNRLTNEYGLDAQILRVYFSGHKGFHIEIPSVIFSLKPSENLPDICHTLATKLAGDITIDNIYQTIRLLRIPNTINAKSGLYKIELCIEDVLRGDLELGHILELAEKPSKDMIEHLDANEFEGLLSHLLKNIADKHHDTLQQTYDNITDAKLNTDKSWIINALDNGVCMGSRTTTLTKLIGHWASKGLSKNEILSLTLMWDKKNSPPLEQTDGNDKVPNTVNDILKRYHNGGIADKSDTENEPQRHRQGSKSASELIAKPPEPKPCIVGGGVLPSWGYTLMGAETKMGKSTLAIQMSLCILTGTRFLNKFDIATKDTHILYLNLEIDEGTLLDTINTQIENFGTNVPLDKLHIWTVNGFCLTDSEDIKELENEIRKNHIKLVIVDPVSYAMKNDQNKYEVVRSFSQQLDSISEDVGGVAWLLVHHYGKPKDANSETIHKMIGSSAFSNFAQSVIGIERYSSNKSPDYKTINFRLRNGRPQQDITTVLNSETRLFEVVEDIAEMTAVKADRVVNILIEAGKPQGYTELSRLIQEKIGVAEAQAKRLISAAVDNVIVKDKGRSGKYWIKNDTNVV